MKLHNSLLILTIFFIAFVSCSYENTATVTIDTGMKQAKVDIIDTLIAFISLSQPAKADPVPGQLNIISIIVTVRAYDIQTFAQNIPLDTGRVTLEIPAGIQRTFEVVGFVANGENPPLRQYGGISTVDLSPGENATIVIKMGRLPNIDFYYDQLEFYISIDEQYIEDIDFVNVFISEDNKNWNFLIRVFKNNFYYDNAYYIYKYDMDPYYIFQQYYKAIGYNLYGMSDEHIIYTQY